MLDLERLRALHAVATYGSVRAAAEVLHVTTSAVSQQLAKLERETGQRLLERNGRGIRLTDAAELLAAHAGRILSMVEEAQADLEAHRGAVVGEVTVATFATGLRGLFPKALRRLADEHPGLRIQVEEADPAQTLSRVAKGDLDLAVVQDWVNKPLAVPEGLARGSICHDPANVALPAGHPHAQADAVCLKDLTDDPWISSTPGSICDDWLKFTLRAEGVEPRIAHMAYEFASQLALVDAGLGAALIPCLGLGEIPSGVRLVPLDPPLSRHIYAVWRAEAARRPAIRAVLAALRP